MDKAFLMALWYDYAASHNGKEPRRKADFWNFAAETILDAFKANADDDCFEWQCSIIDKHSETILATCPELAHDEDSLICQD